MDETEAIRCCQQGEREAFRFVVDQYGKVLYGTAYMMTRDRHLAEDLVQEAFLLAWRNIASFQLGTNFKAWLVRILVNRTISEQRKKRVTQIELEEETAAVTQLWGLIAFGQIRMRRIDGNISERSSTNRRKLRRRK